MKAYVYCAALYCESCAVGIQHALCADGKRNARCLPGYSEDSDTFPQGPFCDGGGEADCPQHCDKCGVFLENPLTRDGVRYVAETIENTDPRNDVVRLWAEFYGADYPGLEFTQLS